jgi:hypothetical protein
MSPPGDAKRPALRKAGDAGVHPTVPPETGDEPSYLRIGATTADAIGMPDKDKLVDLGVQVPKSLRKMVRQEAKRRGITVDEVVAEALRGRSPR